MKAIVQRLGLLNDRLQLGELSSVCLPMMAHLTLRPVKWLTAQLHSDIAEPHHLSLSVTETQGNSTRHPGLSGLSASITRQMQAAFLHADHSSSYKREI